MDRYALNIEGKWGSILSRKCCNFTPEFKAKLVLEVLPSEKDLDQIATDNGIQPNLLRTTKNFFSNIPNAFKSKRKSIYYKLAEERKKKEIIW